MLDDTQLAVAAPAMPLDGLNALVRQAADDGAMAERRAAVVWGYVKPER